MSKPDCIFRWDKAPIRTYKATIPIEEAVTDLINYYNEERARTHPRSLLNEWIDLEQESHENNRTIKEKDVLQVRVIGPKGERNYFLGCCFEFDGKRARLRMYSQNPSLSDILKVIYNKQKEIGAPRTVGDYVLLTKEQQKRETKHIMLQIARFGSKSLTEKNSPIKGSIAKFE